MPAPLIKLENVNFWYDKGKSSENQVLKDINLEIAVGDYVAFFGPSGCGKTTLLYSIAGIELPSSGRVFLNGRDITKFSKRELAVYRQIGVGIVFQQFNLIPSINVMDNITLPMSFLGMSAGKREKEAENLLERFAIKELAHRYPHELSGGEQQRVGVARALANDPPLIVADEPLGNLDSENAKRVLAFLKELNQKDKKTIVMVTHEAWSLSDCRKIFYMKDGAIIKTEETDKADFLTKSISSFYGKELAAGFSSRQLTAGTLSRLFLRGYSADEIKRLEFFILQRLENKIEADVFKNVLDRPYKKGGLGLWRQKAEKTSQYIEDIIEKKREIEEIYRELQGHPESPLKEEIARIRNWLTEDYGGVISEFQKIRLDEIIYQRIRGIIAPRHFLKVLNLSKKKFGIGLSFRASQEFSQKIETLLVGQANV